MPLPWESKGKSSSGLPWVRQREEEEQRLNRFNETVEAFPDLYNPKKQLDNALGRTTPKVDFTAAPKPKVETSKSWVEDRISRDREQASGNAVTRTINQLLEPVSRVVYGGVANIPGVAAFQKGAGDALNIQTDTAPVKGSPLINVPAQIAGNIAGSLTNPSNLAQGFVQAPLNIGRGVAQRVAQRTPELGNRYAQRAIEGAVAGGVQGAALSGVRGETDASQLLESAGQGALFGAAGDAALGGISDAARAIINRYRPKSPYVNPGYQSGSSDLLPALSTNRGNPNRAVTPDVIKPEYTFGLPDISPGTARRIRNIDDGRQDLKTINDEIRQLEASYERAVVDEYRYLENSLKKRGGVKQGDMSFDEDGNVTSKVGRMSENPRWYREYHAEKGKVPSKREMWSLARKRVDNGFEDDFGVVAPSWRSQTSYTPTMNALLDVREELSKSIRELDPALNITDTPLRQQETALKSTSKTPQTRIGQSSRAPLGPEPAVRPQESALTPIDEGLIPSQSIPNRSVISSIGEIGNLLTGGANAGFRRGGTKNDLYSPTQQHIVSGNRKPSSTAGAKADQAYIDTVDDIFSFKRFDDVGAATKNRDLDPSESVYQLAMASRGSDQIVKQSLLNKLVDIMGNIRGGSLKDALASVGRDDRKAWADYMLNKHAITRFARGENVFDKLPDGTKWTPEKGQEIIDNYLSKRPAFQNAEKGFRDFNDRFNQAWLVETGMMPKAVVDSWKKENPFYIDMPRQFGELEKIGGATGARAKSGFGGQKAPANRYSKTGSKRKIIDPSESMIQRYDATIKAAKRNAPMQAMVKHVQENPGAFKGMVEIVPDPPKGIKLSDMDLSNPESLDEVLRLFDDSYEKALKSSRKDLDNVVPVMVNGQPVYLRFHNKQLLDATLNINPQILKGFMGAAQSVGNFQKAIYTGVNPIFTLTRSIFRDPITAYVNSKTVNNPLKFIGDLASATKSVFTNDELYQEFKNIGGGFTSPNVGSPRLINQTKRALLPDDNKLNGAVQRLGHSLQNFLDKVESPTRVAEFKRSKQQGNSYNDRLRGLGESQEVSTNFKRKGARTKELEPFLLYLNASLQSLDKLGRAFKDQPWATTAKIATSVVAPGLALYAMNRNNPDYQKLRDSEKDRFLHIPTGNGTFFRVPIPPELAPFVNTPRRLMERAFRGNDEAWNEFGKTITETVVPPGLSGLISGAVEGGIPEAGAGVVRGTPIVGPTVEAFANKTWLGSPIVPGYLEDASPRNQFTEKTSELSKSVGKVTNTSPAKLDYLLTSIGGDYGKFVQELSAKGRDEGAKAILSSIGKRLVIDSDSSNKLMNQFYDLKDKLDRQYADIKATQKVPAGYTATTDEARKYVNKVASQVSELSASIRAVDSSKELSAADRKKYKEQLVKTRDELVQQTYNAIKPLAK